MLRQGNQMIARKKRMRSWRFKRSSKISRRMKKKKKKRKRVKVVS